MRFIDNCHCIVGGKKTINNECLPGYIRRQSKISADNSSLVTCRNLTLTQTLTLTQFLPQPEYFDASNVASQRHIHTHKHTYAHEYYEPTAPLWTASQVWNKVPSPLLGHQTVVQAGIHLWKTWRLFYHSTQLSLYLQMVPLSRNVTFDSVSLVELASHTKLCEGPSGLLSRTNAPSTWLFARQRLV